MNAYDIDWLLGLGRWVLAGETPEAAAQKLGPLLRESPSQLVVGDERVEIAVQRDEAALQGFSITPKAQGVLPTVAALEARLGASLRAVKTHPNAPLSVVFRVDLDAAKSRT